LLHPRSSGLSDSRRLSPKVVVPAKNRKGDNFHQPASVRRTPQLWELKLNARIAARRKHVALISEKDVPDSFYARSPASSNASSNTIANSPESRELTIRNSTGDDSSASHLLSCVREFEYTCLDSSVRTVDGHRLICLGDTAAKDMKSLVVHLQHTSRPSLRLHIRFQPHNFDQHILPWRLDLSVLDALPGLEKLDVVCSPLDLIARGSVQQLAGFNAAIEQELYRLGDRVVFWRHLQSECSSECFLTV
jgi:hypothetical protein